MDDKTTSELLNLKKLLDEEVLTEEEFDLRKQRLLKSLNDDPAGAVAIGRPRSAGDNDDLLLPQPDEPTSPPSPKRERPGAADVSLKCIDCGGTVSDKALTCPHCGAPMSDIQTDETSPETHSGHPNKLAEEPDSAGAVAPGGCASKIVSMVIWTAIIIGAAYIPFKLAFPSMLTPKEAAQCLSGKTYFGSFEKYKIRLKGDGTFDYHNRAHESFKYSLAQSGKWTVEPYKDDENEERLRIRWGSVKTYPTQANKPMSENTSRLRRSENCEDLHGVIYGPFTITFSSYPGDWAYMKKE